MSEKPKLVWPKCPEELANKFSLKRHLATYHPDYHENEQIDQHLPVPNEKVCFHLCPKLFLTRTDLVSHLKEHFSNAEIEYDEFHSKEGKWQL